MLDLSSILSALLDLPEMVEFPSWANPEVLAGLSLGVIAALLVGAWFVFRMVRMLVARLLVGALAVLLTVSLWYQRAQLGTCADECQCTLFGQAVQIPVDRNPRCQGS